LWEPLPSAEDHKANQFLLNSSRAGNADLFSSFHGSGFPQKIKKGSEGFLAVYFPA